MIAHTPMGRYGLPDDLIGTLVWLLSDASSFVTGVVVPVDGGFSLTRYSQSNCYFGLQIPDSRFQQTEKRQMTWPM